MADWTLQDLLKNGDLNDLKALKPHLPSQQQQDYNKIFNETNTGKSAADSAKVFEDAGVAKPEPQYDPQGTAYEPYHQPTEGEMARAKYDASPKIDFHGQEPSFEGVEPEMAWPEMLGNAAKGLGGLATADAVGAVAARALPAAALAKAAWPASTASADDLPWSKEGVPKGYIAQGPNLVRDPSAPLNPDQTIPSEMLANSSQNSPQDILDKIKAAPMVAQAPSEQKRLTDLVARAQGRKPASTAPTDTITTSAAAPTLQEMLAKLTGGDDAKLAAAQQQAREDRAGAYFARAANIASQGMGAPNKEWSDAINQQFKDANIPVENLQAQNDLRTKKIAQQEAATKLIDDQAKADPNSDASKLGRSIYKEAARRAGMNIPNIDNASLASLEKTMPGIENMANRAMAIQVAKMNKDAALGTKATDKQNQHLHETQMLLESARGNPEVQLAMKNRLLVNNAQSIIDKYANKDKLSNQELSQLALEMGKIASGGVPAEHELQSMMPDTMKSRLAKLYSKFSNSPEPANASEFVKVYSDYLKELRKNGDKVLKDRFGRIIETSKPLVGEDHYKNLNKQYNDFLEPASLKEPTYGEDVLNYAKKYNISPQEAQSYKDSYKGTQ